MTSVVQGVLISVKQAKHVSALRETLLKDKCTQIATSSAVNVYAKGASCKVHVRGEDTDMFREYLTNMVSTAILHENGIQFEWLRTARAPSFFLGKLVFW